MTAPHSHLLLPEKSRLVLIEYIYISLNCRQFSRFDANGPSGPDFIRTRTIKLGNMTVSKVYSMTRTHCDPALEELFRWPVTETLNFVF